VPHFSRFLREVGMQLSPAGVSLVSSTAAVIDHDRACLTESIRTKAAPRPMLGLFQQASLHGFAMDVVQLLNSPGLGPHVEIVEAALPDV